MCESKQSDAVCHRNLKKAEEKVKTLEEEIAENKEKSEGLVKLFKEVEGQATTVAQAYEQAQVSCHSSFAYNTVFKHESLLCLGWIIIAGLSI